MDDIRTYCKQHAVEVINCGYKLMRTQKWHKEECDKCPRQGFEYIQKG